LDIEQDIFKDTEENSTTVLTTSSLGHLLKCLDDGHQQTSRRKKALDADADADKHQRTDDDTIIWDWTPTFPCKYYQSCKSWRVETNPE
jgi:hypothetical protein